MEKKRRKMLASKLLILYSNDCLSILQNLIHELFVDDIGQSH